MTAQPLDGPRGWYPKQERDKLLRRIDDLEAEVTHLRDRIGMEREVNRFAALKLAFPKMRPAECDLVIFLASISPRLASHDVLGEIVVRTDSSDPRNVLGTTICRANRALVDAGCPARAIRPVWAKGYYFAPEARAWLDAHMLPPPDPRHETPATDDPDAIAGQSRGNR